MAILRSYSATFEQNTFAQAAVTRYRFNEGSGTDALDSADDLDGTYVAGAAPGAAGSIGDGAATFDGNDGFVLVETPLSGTVRIATLGDSLATGLTEGNGGFQAAGQTFADELPAALEARGLTVEYLDRAIPGDRTADGLARVDDVLAFNPEVVILELGTNDALAALDPDTVVEANLREIISQLQDGGVDQILLTSAFGFYPDRPPDRSTGYDNAADAGEFEALYAEIAGDTGVTLLQDVDGSEQFLGGVRVAGAPDDLGDDVIVGGVLDSSDQSLVFGDPPDGLHPNAAGIDQIVQRVAPQTIALGAAAGVINEPLQLANGTFEVWFTADVVSGSHNLFAKNSDGQGTGGQVSMAVVSGEIVAAMGDTDQNFDVSGGTVAAGELTQAVLTFGAGGMQLYVDGEQVDTDAHNGGLLGNFEPLVIGAESGLSTPGTVDNLFRFFDGTIDEFAVYDRALTAGEIQQLFEAGEQGDILIGAADADTLIGGSDAEDLRGAGGDDIINGNDGNDTLRGGGGVDIARGGQGDDRFLGGGGADVLLGGPGNDNMRGMGGHDRMVGGGGDDLLQGEGGRDTLTGTDGADELFGGRAIDSLSGGAGDDLLNGGPGRDRLTGGPDSDTYQIDRIADGLDRIFGFEDGEGGDVLDLSAVLDFETGDDVEGFVSLTPINGNTTVDVDPNGGGDDFTTVFRLVNTTGLDINNLVTDGNIDLGAPTS